MSLPDAIASVFSSSWASLPIQTNTWKCETLMHFCCFHGSDSSLNSRNMAKTVTALVSLPAPRCRGSWHHQWRGHLGSAPRVPPRSEGRKRTEWCCGGGTVCTDSFGAFRKHIYTCILISSSRGSFNQRLTMKFPVLLEQAKSLGGWASILSLSLVDVRYSVFPPRASQNWSVKTTDALQVIIVLCITTGNKNMNTRRA